MTTQERLALNAVNRLMEGEKFEDVRTALLWLAEDGAFGEYEGDGWFSDNFDSIHIDDLTNREIARFLIRNYY